MTIVDTQMDNAQMLALTGRLDSDSVQEFELKCNREIRDETKTLVIDLTGLEYLSSAGLRTILSTGKAIQGKGGKLILCAPKGPTRNIVEAAGFHKLFQVCGTVAETGLHQTGNFQIHMHKEWDVDIMTVWGRVDAERAPELEAAGRKVLEMPYLKLLINMSAVEYLSSAGLCALLNLMKLAKEKHGRLFLCSPSPAVRQILKTSGFDKILAIRDSVQDALTE